MGSVLVEDDRCVHHADRCDDLRALPFGIDRAIGALVGAHRSIGVDAHDEHVPLRTRGPQVAHVPRMQQIVDAVGEDDPAAGSAVAAHELHRLGVGKDPHQERSVMATFTADEKVQRWRGRHTPMSFTRDFTRNV